MEFNYAELLSYDRAASVTLSTSESARKLVAWDNRLDSTDYPQEWQVDLRNGEFVTLSLTQEVATELIWEGEGGVNQHHKLTILLTDSIVTEFKYEGIRGSATLDSVTEGLITLDDTTIVHICDPDTRSGIEELKITYSDMARSQITEELDDYCYSQLGVLSDTEIKGHRIDSVWRLSEITKKDSDSPDAVSVVLVYKKGYAQELIFSEALILNKEDYRTDSTRLVIKFPNLDPRYVETAKDAYRSQDSLSNPVFAGVVYEGAWNNIRMITSETDRYGEANGSSEVIWMLSQHNNQDLYFKYRSSDASIKGHYFKWEATQATINTLLTETRFEEDGTIDELPYSGTSSTLQDEVAGRIVAMRRTVRDDDDMLFDLEIEITWMSSISYGGDGTPDGGYVIKTGEPEEITTFIQKYVGPALPSGVDVVGEVDDGGQSKTVTRIQNADISGGVFNYDLYMVRYTAPINYVSELLPNEWFTHSFVPRIETEDNKIQQYRGTDASIGYDKYYLYAMPRWRLNTILRERKYFVRYPTTADLASAGIEMIPSGDDIITAANDAEVSYDTERISKHLFVVTRVTVTKGDWDTWTILEGSISYEDTPPTKQSIDVPNT